jgi:hypothetical protein
LSGFLKGEVFSKKILFPNFMVDLKIFSGDRKFPKGGHSHPHPLTTDTPVV